MLPRLATIREFEMNNECFFGLPKEVVSKMKEQLSILDEAYGKNRSVIENSGGYIQVIENVSEWNAFLVEEQIEENLYEFVETINNEYVYIVYVISSDFSIGVIVLREIIEGLITE